MKRILYIVLIVLIAMLVGCRPEGILDSDKMREVLVDLHKMDAMLQVSDMDHGYDEQKNIYYALVLEKHGVTQAQFDSSLVWYTARPHLFNKIYPKVLSDLSKERQAFQEAHADELNPKPSTTETQRAEQAVVVQEAEVTEVQTRQGIDSVLWMMRHGVPTSWNPYPYIGPVPPMMD